MAQQYVVKGTSGIVCKINVLVRSFYRIFTVIERNIILLIIIYQTINIICKACDKGYVGQNCDIKCPYLFNGYDCQSMCDRDFTYCDHVNGCKQFTEGKLFYQI